MSKTARDRRPNLRPPTRIEVNEGNTRRRVILLVVCIAIAITAFSYGVTGLIKSRDKSGFTEIISSGTEASCADDFRFYYQLGEKNGNALYRTLSALWERETVLAYRYFEAEETFAGIGNLASLSASPNEEVELEPALYAALETLERSGTRVHYLAPIELHYRSVFYAESDYVASQYDIAKNPELSAYYSALAAFARDPSSVQIELLGDNTARLSVSDEYLAFTEKNEISTFVSLGYLKNAFICDYLAAAFIDAGFTEGVLSSDDGFSRNLDTASGRSYTFNLFCRAEGGIDIAAKMQQERFDALIFLRAYPLSSSDSERIYVFDDGKTMTGYLDPASGGAKTSADNLVLYGGESCAELMLAALPLWVADSLDPLDLLALDCEAIWCTDREIRCTDPAAPVFDLHPSYTKVNITP
jgi:hypothetical protein